ncbi:MAG: FAD-binding oxidoreductase [Dehalococcoidales bacterium]|nr:FAD-binding oxidoreductase [Dehalococcoidales bacterium]
MVLKEELASIVSTENILDNPEVIEAYSKDLSFVKPIKPRMVVKPQDTEEVQSIVNWANKTQTPLVPVSSGPPRFRGDTIPSVPGAVVVDLSGMKKIIRIDVRNKLAMIEAGVTYAELQPELAKEGLRLFTPLAPRANKSVVASLLEREPTTAPRFQWSSVDPLRCTAIIWGDGQKLVTGDAGNFSSLEEAWKRKQAPTNPAGPGQSDFYRFVSGAQGSMGIVTWASVKCDVLPSAHKLFFVSADKYDELLGFTYKVLKYRFADELLILNKFDLASIMGDGVDDIEALMRELPSYVAIVGIVGRTMLPEERVAYQEKDIRDIAQSFGMQLVPAIPGTNGIEVLKVLLTTSKEPYWRLAYKGGYQDIFFLTTLDKTPDFLQTMNSVAEASGYPTSEIGFYVQPLHQGASCHCEFLLPYDNESPKETAKMQQLYITASKELLKQGAFYSRPYGIWANMAFNRDAQTTNTLRKLKGIFDPNNIMNPGKLCF